jgi:DNA transformation protein
MTNNHKLSNLPNLGPKSSMWLNAIGIYTFSDMESVGAVEIYRQLRELGYPASLNLVYAIHGAIINCPWNHLPPDIRDDLRAQIAQFKNQKG